MRRRYGQNSSSSEVEEARTSEETEDKEGIKSSGEKTDRTKGSKGVSWMDAIRTGTQLTLDLIRVIREAADLKRKLFP
ncbi:MAG: hypothetical protein PHP64_08390 [Actinomycetota bacterium]|nr:hypothetical protein [Actinomycetota bacterium]